jgi:hypothetical protein
LVQGKFILDVLEFTVLWSEAQIAAGNLQKKQKRYSIKAQKNPWGFSVVRRKIHNGIRSFNVHFPAPNEIILDLC